MNSIKEKKNLFKISKEYEEIIEEIILSDGEVDENLYKKLESIEYDFNNKSESYVYLIKKTENDNEYIDAEIKRLQNRKKINNNLIDRLKSNLMNSLICLDKTKIKTPLYTIRIQNNPPSVRIVDENLIPDDFKEERVSVYINKKSILQLLKNGEDVKGTEIIQGKSLRIN